MELLLYYSVVCNVCVLMWNIIIILSGRCAIYIKPSMCTTRFELYTEFISCNVV